jgi:hypothetical protein
MAIAQAATNATHKRWGHTAAQAPLIKKPSGNVTAITNSQ